MEENNTSCEIRLYLLGNASVGKTSFILKYVNDIFREDHIATVGIDYMYKETTLPNEKKVNLKFIDTAGQEKYRAIAYNLIKSAEGIILMYDITDMKSFEAIPEWVENIREYKGNDFPIVLVGNKCDLEDKREVTKEEGNEEAKKNGFLFYEANNKDGINVEEVVSTLALKVYKKKAKKGKDKEKNMNLKKYKKKKKRC